MTATKRGLEPLVDGNSRVLVLGTLPGDESLRLQRYYSHGRNEFWAILEGVYGEPVGDDYAERTDFLRRHGIALWDVLKSADRRGSLDSAIKNPVPNDFAKLFAEHPGIRCVALNGSGALTFFRRWAAEQVPPHVQISELPSSSSTPGKHVASLGEKVERWQSVLKARHTNESA